MSPWGNVIGGCSPLWVTPSPGQGILSHIKKLVEIPASQPAARAHGFYCVSVAVSSLVLGHSLCMEQLARLPSSFYLSSCPDVPR